MAAEHKETQMATTEEVEMAGISTIDTATMNEGHLVNYTDHEETMAQALRSHPWAVIWCVYAMWAVLITAFDFAAPSAVLGIPTFRKDFGYAFEGDYILPANWQAAFSGGPVATGAIGSILAGFLGDYIGRKGVLLLGYIIVFVGVTLEMVATTDAMFFVAKFIIGFAIGFGLTTAFSYMGDVAPPVLRGVIPAVGSLAFVIAQLMVALIQRYTSNQASRWAYRGIFVGQYAITFLGLVFLPFLPESPYWLVIRRKDEKAARSLRKLGYKAHEIDQRISNIKLTLEEAREETSRTSFLDCFRKSNLRRTVVAVAPICIQNFGGYYFVSAYLTYYAQLVGYSTQTSFVINIISQVVAFVGCVLSWFSVDRIGRRDLNIYGMAFLTVVLLIAGGLAATEKSAYIKVTIGLFIVYQFFYWSTIGVTAFISLAEIATPRLRIKTAAIGILFENAIVCVLAFVVPYIFNPNKANLQGKTSFIFGGLNIISTIWLFFYFPETANRTFKEIDEMFIKGVPAREFKNFKTDAEVRGNAIASAVRTGKE